MSPINLNNVDEDGYKTLWDFTGGEQALASRILTFMCQHQFPTVRISQNEMQLLTQLFDANDDVRYSWSIDSSHVNTVASRLRVHAVSLNAFLQDRAFNPAETNNPKRETRNVWIDDVWIVV